MQEVNIPEINSSFGGFEIEMLFEYSDDDVGCLSKWYFGKMDENVSEKKRTVKIKWNEFAWVMVMKWKQSRSYLRQNGIHKWGMQVPGGNI
jgi:hypothetical protein